VGEEHFTLRKDQRGSRSLLITEQGGKEGFQSQQAEKRAAEKLFWGKGGGEKEGTQSALPGARAGGRGPHVDPVNGRR